MATIQIRQLILLFLIFLQQQGSHSSKITCDNFKELGFRHSPLGIDFVPHVSEADVQRPDRYTENDLLVFIRLISTRFTLVVTPYIDQDKKQLEDSALRIPTAVARFNKAQLMDQKLDETTVPFQTVKVIIPFVEDLKLVDQQRQTSFDIVKDLGDRANSVHRETVSGFALQTGQIHSRNVPKIQRQLEYSSRILRTDSSSFSYKLGAIMPILNCNDVFLQTIIPQISFIYFNIWSEPQIKDDTNFDKYISQMKSKMMACKKSMEKPYPDVQVGFRTYWPDTDMNGNQNISKLVSFWYEMNKLSLNENIPVILHEAFDVPMNGVSMKTRGWWRLLENKSPQSVSDYSFEEKCSLLAVSDDIIKSNNTTVTTPIVGNNTETTETSEGKPENENNGTETNSNGRPTNGTIEQLLQGLGLDKVLQNLGLGNLLETLSLDNLLERLGLGGLLDAIVKLVATVLLLVVALIGLLTFLLVSIIRALTAVTPSPRRPKDD